ANSLQFDKCDNDMSNVSSMIENESMKASTIEDSYTHSPVNSEDDWDQ
uniref:Uncharacterized protein n=1 Tax=Acrobeloides nanus TaxID=290746 RepID=A0A914DBV0_9BILA